MALAVTLVPESTLTETYDMTKKARTHKKTTPRKKSPSNKAPLHAGPRKKTTQKKKRSTKCAEACSLAERKAVEADLAEKLTRYPRVSAAFRRHTEVSERHGRGSPQAKASFLQFLELMEAAQGRKFPAALRLPEYTPNDPRDEAHVAERDQLHDVIMAGGVYSRLTRPLAEQIWGSSSHVSEETAATNLLHAGDVLQQMRPRDPMEKMLVAQALWTHGRIAHLTDLLVFEKSYKGIKVLSDAIDRASNLFRRQMLALAEYRRPPRAAGMLNKIGQANIANQQIVQNGQAPARPSHDGPTQPSEENTTNELGLQHGQPDPAISAQPRGQTLATGGGEEEPALVEIDRSED